MTDHLHTALAVIDAANAADPNLEMDLPAALLYGQRMSAELERLFPDASDVLKIAARGQHVERWLLPRSAYPEGKAGYLDWRREQGRHGRRTVPCAARARLRPRHAGGAGCEGG